MEYNNRPVQVMKPQGIFRDGIDDGVGPYTVEEMNRRIDEAEAVIAKAEQGDTSGWVTAKQMDAELYSTFPWLR